MENLYYFTKFQNKFTEFHVKVNPGNRKLILQYFSFKTSLQNLTLKLIQEIGNLHYHDYFI